MNAIIVRFCAIECELQQSGERSVSWMFSAWQHADMTGLPLTTETIDDIGRIVEPSKNHGGFRQCGVRVGRDIKPDWQDVPRQLGNLVDAQDELTPAEWFYQFEEIHPFRDGNGRTGQILYNLLNNTMVAPVWAPNYWDDPRRHPGDGAP